MSNKRTLRIACPEDGALARIIPDPEIGFRCTHACDVNFCPAHCSARAILNEPEKSTRMQIVCPKTHDTARIVLKEDEIVWCSHRYSVENCQKTCLQPGYT